MPELPEVETVRKDLQKMLRGSKIVDVEVRKKKMVKGDWKDFRESLKGEVIESVKRRGKLLVFNLRDSDLFLLLHMKMTGQLIYEDKDRLAGGGHGEPKARREDLPNKYSHVIFVLAGGAKLFFNDMRQFGYVKLADKVELEKILSRFGVEPLSKKFTVGILRDLLKGRKTTLKNVLLNQQLLAGLGNIYVDEVCFLAGVRPSRRADKVTAEEVKRLHAAILRVLKKAIIKRGTTFSSYRDGLGGEGGFSRLLKVYGRSGKACFRCGNILRRIKVGGRGTVYCAKCQK